MKTQSAKVPTKLFLEFVEIVDDFLVWKDFREKLGLNRSKNYPVGGVIPAVMGGINSMAPYMRVNARGVCYQIPYGKALQWAKTKKEPKKQVWFVDGDKSNLRASNVDGNFHAWWERQDKQAPVHQKTKPST